VIRTRVGYAGGTKKNPTYYSLGDHAETIQIDYDPARISYAQLLDMFWKSHQPDRKSWSRQYMAAVFYHTDEQKQLALQTRDQEAKRLQIKIQTEIIPATPFYLAEDYHQKYYLRRDRELAREFTTIYPVLKDFISSTAVSRANSYVGGYGSVESLQKEIARLGLTPAGSRRLMEIVQALDKNSRYAAKGGAYCPVPF
jgi:peptide-methionine (S)-S-oxide reductase